MKQHNLPQGSPEWHAHRARARNASDAPAVLGCSNYTTRAQLLHQKHTGIRPEVSPDQQRRFDNGHSIEAAQLPGAEEIIGEALAPVVGTAVVDGIELSASFDGLPIMEDVPFECKTLNDALRAALPNPGPDGNDAANLPKMYRVQMEQQLAVCSGERVLFVAATRDGSDVRRCWYYPDLALRAEILAGWRQFEADLATYLPPEPAAPAAVAAPVESLPAVQVRMDGALTVHSNLDAFGQALRTLIGKIPAQPTTDQDFADTEAACKALKRAEEALEAEEKRALAGMADVEQMRRMVADLAAMARSTRLQREKLVKARKDQLRTEQVQRGRAALAAYLQGMNQSLGAGLMPDIPADFAGVISGKKTMASIADAIDTELARAKIEAGEVFQRIQANLKTLREHDEHKHLFPDVTMIVQKAPEDLQALVCSRIAEHRVAEERRAAELAERERARIRAEEEARARAAAAQEQAAREAAERRQREETEAEFRRLQQAADEAARAEQRQKLIAELPPEQTYIPPSAPAAAGNVLPMPTKAPAGPPTLRLGQINERLQHCKVTAEDLSALGFPAAGRDRAAVLFHEADWPGIVTALIRHLESVREQRRAA